MQQCFFEYECQPCLPSYLYRDNKNTLTHHIPCP
nr:MAG TPA: hypothetical protein [Caudoviricetes sp.]